MAITRGAIGQARAQWWRPRRTTRNKNATHLVDFGRGRLTKKLERNRMKPVLVALLVAVFSFGGSVSAQWTPSKPIRLIVPRSPGGSADAVTRVLADGLSRVLPQRVIVENRAGASGNIGSEIAAKSAPDGY